MRSPSDEAIEVVRFDVEVYVESVDGSAVYIAA